MTHEEIREILSIALRGWAFNGFGGKRRPALDEDMIRLMDLCEQYIGQQEDRPERTRA